MELNIYNPAAAATTVASQTSSGGSPKPVESTPRVSQLSLMRAANGDPRLSAETLAAIATGKVLPPTIQQPKETPSLEGGESTSQQTSAYKEPAVKVKLSPHAQGQLATTASSIKTASFNEAAASIGVDIKV